jgi:DNA-binding Xre family transcriptional regulator
MPEEWVELTDLRRRSAKNFQKHIDGYATNQFLCEAVAGAPLHYPDEAGALQDIDATLVPSTRSITGFGNPAWEMVENEYEMFVLGELNSGVPLVRYQAKHTDYYVQFAAHNLEWSNDLDQLELIATPATTPTEAAGSEAKWPDSYGLGLDLRFIAGAGRMAKWLDIATALPDPPQFIIDGGNPVIRFSEILEFHKDLDVYVNGQKWNKSSEVATAQEIEFRSPDGEVQFVFPVAHAYHEGPPPDVEESDYEEEIAGEARLKKQGPNLYITVRFPWSWFGTEGFAYPLHLDTTVDKYVAASGDDGYVDSSGAFDNTGASFWIGKATGKVRESWLLWTGVTAEGTIDVSYIRCYGQSVAGSPLMNIYGVDEDNPAAPTSYDEFVADPLTTAYVAWDGVWTSGVYNQSGSLNSIFQELVDTYTISNEAVMVQIKDDGSSNGDYNGGRAYDAAGNNTAHLYIEYSAVSAIVKLMAETVGVPEADLYRNRAVRLITETVGVAEGLIRRMWSARPFAETVGVADSLLRKASSVRLIAETVGIAETFVKVTFTTIVKLMAETVGLAESAVRRMWSVRLKAETVGISESLLRRLWSTRLMAETISLQGALVRRMWSVRMKAETVSIQEGLVRITGLVKQMAETVGITDAMQKIAGMVRVASETVGIVESWVKVTVSTIVKIMATETIGLVESTIKRFWATRLMTETVGLSDSAIRRAWAVRLMAATIGLQETIIKRMWSVRQIAETVGISEAGVLRKRFVKIISETIGLVESFVKAVSLYLGIEEIELDSYITLSVDLDSAITRTVDKTSAITRTWEADSHIQ